MCNKLNYYPSTTKMQASTETPSSALTLDTERIIRLEPVFVRDKKYISLQNGRYLMETHSSIDKGRDYPRAYLAWDTHMQLLVTLKFYYPNSADELRSYDKEITFAEKGKNAHAFRLLNAFEEEIHGEKRKFIVSYAYVEGSQLPSGEIKYHAATLDQLVGYDNTNLQNQARFHLVGQIYQAVLDLWESGQVHWDLKPQNVVIKGEFVYFIDFGLAMRLAETSNYEMGTTEYSSPERQEAGNTFSAEDLKRSESFSLYLVIFYILFAESLLALNLAIFDEVDIHRVLVTIDLNNPSLLLTQRFTGIIQNSQYPDTIRHKLELLFKKALVKNSKQRLELSAFMHELGQIQKELAASQQSKSGAA